MTAYELETIGALKSIDATMKELLALSKTKRAAQPVPKGTPMGDTEWMGAVQNFNFEDKYADPIIKAKDPRDWSGPTMLGRHLSECPPEYLDALAARYDYFVSQSNATNVYGKTPEEIAEIDKKTNYNKLDAAKARAWAARLRSGYKPKTQNEATDHVLSEDIKW